MTPLPDRGSRSSHEALEAALRRRERQLAGNLDTAMDAIITIDADVRIQLFNRAASRNKTPRMVKSVQAEVSKPC